MKNFQEFLKDIERDLVVNIVLSLRHERMTKKDAKKVSSEFVGQTFENYEDLFKKLYELCRNSREVRKVYVKFAPSYYLEKDAEMLKNMRDYLMVQDFEGAIEMTKGGDFNGK